MNRKQAEAALARCEAATEGPWEMPEGYPHVIMRYYDAPGGNIVVSSNIGRPEDARFVRHARTDLPDALTMLKRAAVIIKHVTLLGKSGECQQCADAERWLEEWNGPTAP